MKTPTQVVHWKKSSFDYYVGRNYREYGIPAAHAMPAFANPFEIGTHGTRMEVIAKYEAHIREEIKNNPGLVPLLKQMKGKKLACWCTPQRCHAEIIVKLINEFFPD